MRYAKVENYEEYKLRKKKLMALVIMMLIMIMTLILMLTSFTFEFGAGIRRGQAGNEEQFNEETMPAILQISEMEPISLEIDGNMMHKGNKNTEQVSNTSEAVLSLQSGLPKGYTTNCKYAISFETVNNTFKNLQANGSELKNQLVLVLEDYDGNVYEKDIIDTSSFVMTPYIISHSNPNDITSQTWKAKLKFVNYGAIDQTNNAGASFFGYLHVDFTECENVRNN